MKLVRQAVLLIEIKFLTNIVKSPHVHSREGEEQTKQNRKESMGK